MIVSASRRTDIPALFSSWFYNRVEKGFVLLRNPYNPLQVGRVTLSPDKVDGIVFWTKNAAPMLPRIHELDSFKYYFQYTITPYGREIEQGIPDKEEVVIPALKKIGAAKVVWRYDPIIFSEKYTEQFHEQAFAKLASELEGHTSRVVISFVDAYRGVDLKAMGARDTALEQKRALSQRLLEIAAAHGMALSACAEADLGLLASGCVSGAMFGVKKPLDRNQRAGCTCVESVDIGAYSTCRNGCLYCYANPFGWVKDVPGPDCDLLDGPLRGDERVKQRN